MPGLPSPSPSVTPLPKGEAFLQHRHLLPFILRADERAGGRQAADAVAVGVGHRYRVRSLPATGALIRAEDEGEQMSLL